MSKDRSTELEEWPEWYRTAPETLKRPEISGRVGSTDFFFCERQEKQLIVSFDLRANSGHRELDWAAWTDAFAHERGWSHLALISLSENWFRDPQAIEKLEQLNTDGFFEKFGNVCLFGADHRGAGFAALVFADLCQSTATVSFAPQSTLNPQIVPWESRFPESSELDWNLPRSDAAFEKGAAMNYVVYDPFDRIDARHVERLGYETVKPFHAFGLGNEAALGLRRLGLLGNLLETATSGHLNALHFYNSLRARKDLYLYRQHMEAHLKARGQNERLKQFTKAFKTRTKMRRHADQKTSDVHDSLPFSQTENIKPKLAAKKSAWPRTKGNVWGLVDDGTEKRYFSDQYRGQMMGFVERGEITLAETPPLAIGIAAFGHGIDLERRLPERFNWHVVDETLDGRGPALAAESHGVIMQRRAQQTHSAYQTVIAVSAGQVGVTAHEAAPDSDLQRALFDRIKAARLAANSRDKDFFIDRICLSLLAGTPETGLQDASLHYAQVAQALRHGAATAAGQSSYPFFVVSQSAGTSTDGRSEVILAEGALDIAHPALGFIVATPKYPFFLSAGMPATPDPTEQVLIDELEAMAVATVQRNEKWFCPSIRQAWAQGSTVVVEFSSMGDLELAGGDHGFVLECSNSDNEITSVIVEKDKAFLSLKHVPEANSTFVNYAWGKTARASTISTRSANTGAVREVWSTPSIVVEGKRLHRYALSGRVRVMPSNLSTALPEALS